MLEDIQVIKPTLLIGVPQAHPCTLRTRSHTRQDTCWQMERVQVYNRIYGGIQTKLAELPPLKKRAFELAMVVAQKRRQACPPCQCLCGPRSCARLKSLPHFPLPPVPQAIARCRLCH